MKIEHRPLSELKGAARNPKRHDLERIKASIRRFGYVAPVVEDAATGRVVAGHGRIAALLEMMDAGEPTPARVEEQLLEGVGVEWCVPVLTGVPFASEKEAEAYLLADNRLVELGGWDAELLHAMLADHDALPLGWSDEDVAALERSIGQEVADPQAEWRGMPEFEQEQVAAATLLVYFRSTEDKLRFAAEVLCQPCTPKTKMAWWPEAKPEPQADRRYVGEPEA